MKKLCFSSFFVAVFSASILAQTVTVSGVPAPAAANAIYTLNNSGSFQYTTIEVKDAGTDAYFTADAVFSATGQYQIYRNGGNWKIGRVICNGCTTPSTNLYYQTVSNTSKPPCTNNWMPVGGGALINITLTGDCVSSGPTSVKATTVLPTAVSLPQLTATDIAAIASPQKGMLVYDLTNNCVKIYNGTNWKCLTDQ
jgi:hypothetical protein